jgi:hypothetical protein
MVQVVPGRNQGFAAAVSGSLGQLVERSLDVVEFLPLAPCLLSVETLP